MTDYIKRADVLKYPIRLDHYDEENGSRLFVYGVESVIEYVESLPSADAVDCTDFIEWLVDRVLDETIWEYNSVAYGEIICRKLEKLGILEVTEEPSYYIRPSADAEVSYLNAFYDGFNTATLALQADEELAESVKVVRCKDCRHAYCADNRVPHERTWVCERFMNEEVNANDFCSWGERREE